MVWLLSQAAEGVPVFCRLQPQMLSLGPRKDCRFSRQPLPLSQNLVHEVDPRALELVLKRRKHATLLIIRSAGRRLEPLFYMNCQFYQFLVNIVNQCH